MSAARELHADRDRAESFGASAETYDRARPGYPDALIDDLMAEGPGDALDVGCGTGKAARPLAARGVRVLGVEPDERMADVARSYGIEVEIGVFEDWDPAGRKFDLLVSGQAWHWVDPVAGPAKALEVLRPTGRLAAFWNVARLPEEVSAQLDAVYDRLAPEIDPYSVVRGCGRVAHDEGPADFKLSGFTQTEARRYTWDLPYSRREWLELVATHSDHSRLPGPQLAGLLDAVGDVIDSLGGSVTAAYTTYAGIARP